jgi:hypothetical protein
MKDAYRAVHLPSNMYAYLCQAENCLTFVEYVQIILLTLIMKAVNFPATSDSIYRTTPYDMPQHFNLHAPWFVKLG